MTNYSFEITEPEIQSVKDLLQKMFCALPMEVIEDAVGDTMLYMLTSHRGYKITSGNLFALSKFKLYKEKQKVSTISTFEPNQEDILEDASFDTSTLVKEGTLDYLIESVANRKDVLPRDIDIFKRAVVSGEPVKEIANKENLALSPTYRIIKRVKKKIREEKQKTL